MTTFFLILAIILVIAIGWLASQSPDFHVLRKRVIKADAQSLFKTVRDLQSWKNWSPWLMHDPHTVLVHSDSSTDVGSWYSWEGKIVGAGQLTHRSFEENRGIEQDIVFTAPMKSKSHVYWRFEPVDEGTEVTWGMRGKMPFLFRWMTRMMDEWVGKDYEIGLAKLAMVAGDDREAFALSFEGKQDVEAISYAFKHFEGSIKEMSQEISAGFQSLLTTLQEQQIEITDYPFCIYHKFDKKKDFVSCDMAIPVAHAKSGSGFERGNLPAATYMRTTLKGDYERLEWAWHSAFSHLRMAKYKWKKSAPLIERYPTDPTKISGMDLVTYIDIPLKC